MASYRRECVHCGYPIVMRRMPYAQWVPFEGDDPTVAHVCGKGRWRTVPIDKKPVGPTPPPSAPDDRRPVFDALDFMDVALPGLGASRRGDRIEKRPAQDAPQRPTREPRTSVLVCPDGLGYTRSISAALALARPGGRVRLRPGTYRERLDLDRDIELVGEGGPAAVTIEATGACALRSRAAQARVEGITLRVRADGRTRDMPAVEVRRGQITIEGCTITSETGPGVVVAGHESDPTIRRCRIQACAGAGLVVELGAAGTIEGNDIADNAGPGVAISARANPIVRGNRIAGNAGNGVRVSGAGLGALERNDLRGNGGAGLLIASAGNPTATDNRIRGGRAGGIVVQEQGRGTLIECEVSGNAGSGVALLSGAAATVRDCRVAANTGFGVWIDGAAGGGVAGCDLRGNARGPWNVVGRSAVRRDNNRE